MVRQVHNLEGEGHRRKGAAGVEDERHRDDQGGLARLRQDREGVSDRFDPRRRPGRADLVEPPLQECFLLLTPFFCVLYHASGSRTPQTLLLALV